MTDWVNEPPEKLAQLFEHSRTIAVVGLSANRFRASHSVSEYMQQAGYRIIPVNPNITEALGERAYPSLEEVPEPVDIVNIFRRPEFVRPIVEAAIRKGAKAVWMQDTVEDAEAGRLARRAGLAVVMDDCIMRQHARWLRHRAQPEK